MQWTLVRISWNSFFEAYLTYLFHQGTTKKCIKSFSWCIFQHKLSLFSLRAFHLPTYYTVYNRYLQKINLDKGIKTNSRKNLMKQRLKIWFLLTTRNTYCCCYCYCYCCCLHTPTNVCKLWYEINEVYRISELFISTWLK